MTPRGLVLERPFSARLPVLAAFLTVFVAGLAAGGAYRIAATYLAMLVPLGWPILSRLLHRNAGPSQLAVEIAPGALVWTSWLGLRRRLTKAQIDGSAILHEDGPRRIVLSIGKTPTAILVAAERDSADEVVNALGIGDGRLGTLRFLTAWRLSVGTIILRFLPIATALLVDGFGNLGWSTYLLLVPPFQVMLLLAVARASSFPLELRPDGLFLLEDRISDYGSIRTVEEDGQSVTVTWLSGQGEQRRQFPLATGHEWQSKALQLCIERAAHLATSRKERLPDSRS